MLFSKSPPEEKPERMMGDVANDNPELQETGINTAVAQAEKDLTVVRNAA